MSDKHKIKIILIEDIKIETKPVITGLPEGIYVEYWGELPDGDLFVILRPEEGWDYTDFVLLTGNENGMETRHKITNVTRSRDGGTTEIESELGKFFFPTRLGNWHKNPTLNGEEITLYDRPK